jgi:hypothetical protein
MHVYLLLIYITNPNIVIREGYLHHLYHRIICPKIAWIPHYLGMEGVLLIRGPNRAFMLILLKNLTMIRNILPFIE